jgi:endonuclease VIII
MPEGDTVWNTAKLLTDSLAGAEISHAEFRVPSLATVDLAGAVVQECACRGKHLLLRLNRPGPKPAPGLTLHSHLRMDGSWRVFAPGQRWHGGPSHTIRVVLRSAAAVAVGYHLHELALVPSTQEHTLVGHLGPDLLGPAGAPGGWDPAEALRRLRGLPERTIGQALLDQRCLAGIGNLYRAEVLFLHGIHPWRHICTVDNLEVVVNTAQRLLRANLGRWTQSTTGSLRRGEEVYVYGRSGAPCRRCGTLIRRAPDGPRPAEARPVLAVSALGERIVFWCPRCQPESG